MFDILVTALPQIRAGKARALAVASAKRSPLARTYRPWPELGVAGYTQAGNEPWFGTSRQCPALVTPHQAGVADHVCGNDCRQFALLSRQRHSPS